MEFSAVLSNIDARLVSREGRRASWVTGGEGAFIENFLRMILEPWSKIFFVQHERVSCTADVAAHMVGHPDGGWDVNGVQSAAS